MDALTAAIDDFIAGAAWSVEDEPELVPRPGEKSLREIAEDERHWRVVIVERASQRGER